MPLPAPSADELAHSEQVKNLIQADIRAHGGWISFARYMELALYAPGLGYYSGGATKLGKEGDFITAPELSSLFGQTLAVQVAQVLKEGAPYILELGAGSGKLAIDLLMELTQLNCLPERYFVLEVSADLRQRQQLALSRCGKEIIERVTWLDQLPSNFEGVVIANEVLDALPVHVVAWKKEGIVERGVAVADGKFVWQDKSVEGEVGEQAHTIDVSPDYISEINLAGPGLVRSLAQAMERGVMLFIDYGFPKQEYYHPQRSTGTLMCHYRHRAHSDPFYLPGLQDITAHVNFSAIAEATKQSGLAVMGYSNLAQFLINCDVLQVMQRTSVEDISAYLPIANAAQKLLNPAEMGELFKVIALGKNVDYTLKGFSAGNKSEAL